MTQSAELIKLKSELEIIQAQAASTVHTCGRVISRIEKIISPAKKNKGVDPAIFAGMMARRARTNIKRGVKI